MIGDFFKDHWRVIVIALIGVAFGVFLNHVARKYSNRQLLGTLTDELSKLQIKPNLTEEEQKHIQYLEGEIYILKFKCA